MQAKGSKVTTVSLAFWCMFSISCARRVWCVFPVSWLPTISQHQATWSRGTDLTRAQSRNVWSAVLRVTEGIVTFLFNDLMVAWLFFLITASSNITVCHLFHSITCTCIHRLYCVTLEDGLVCLLGNFLNMCLWAGIILYNIFSSVFCHATVCNFMRTDTDTVVKSVALNCIKSYWGFRIATWKSYGIKCRMWDCDVKKQQQKTLSDTYNTFKLNNF